MPEDLADDPAAPALHPPQRSRPPRIAPGQLPQSSGLMNRPVSAGRGIFSAAICSECAPLALLVPPKRRRAPCWSHQEPRSAAAARCGSSAEASVFTVVVKDVADVTPTPQAGVPTIFAPHTSQSGHAIEASPPPHQLRWPRPKAGRLAIPGMGWALPEWSLAITDALEVILSTVTSRPNLAVPLGSSYGPANRLPSLFQIALAAVTTRHCVESTRCSAVLLRLLAIDRR